jgi:hypothetical protein
MAEFTTNDDAVIDCVVYANDVRMGVSAEGIQARRVVKDPPQSVSGCSISMCGNDDDPECRLLRYCPNGHCMHDKCLEYMFTASESLSTVMCPQCRSDHVVNLIVGAKPIPTETFEKMWSADAVAARAIQRFVPEVRGGASMLPMLLQMQQQGGSF